jgi:hypothetical protein
MMDQTYGALCERIREKSQQQKWYGGDNNNTARFSERGERYDRHYGPDETEIIIDQDPDDHPRKTSFEYPPATEEQLLTTENELGFPLPPLLRALYAHLANGGFGPGYGIHGARGGFYEAGDIADGYLFHMRRSQMIELETYKKAVRSKRPLEFPDTAWPRYLLYLCDWGFATTSCLDAKTGQVFHVYPSTRDKYYKLKLQAASLEDWLGLWLKGRLKDKGKYIKSRNKNKEKLGKFSVTLLFKS